MAPERPSPRIQALNVDASYPVSARFCPMRVPRHEWGSRCLTTALQSCRRALTEAASICGREASQVHDAEVEGHGPHGCRRRCRLAQRLVRPVKADPAQIRHRGNADLTAEALLQSAHADVDPPCKLRGGPVMFGSLLQQSLRLANRSKRSTCASVKHVTDEVMGMAKKQPVEDQSFELPTCIGVAASPGPASNSLRTMFNDSRHPPAVGEDKSMTGSKEMGPEPSCRAVARAPSRATVSESSSTAGCSRPAIGSPPADVAGKRPPDPARRLAPQPAPCCEIARPRTGTLTW